MKWENGKPILTNESEVLYMFSRMHERLGFEKILHISSRFPDVLALRNGREVRIELEYKLSSFKLHYKIGNWGYASIGLIPFYKHLREKGLSIDKLRWKYNKKHKAWMLWHPAEGFFIEEHECEYYALVPELQFSIHRDLL